MALSVAALAAIAPGAALAATPTTFSYTGSVQTYTVPAGVTAINVNAVGGTVGTSGPLGGRGAVVTSDIPVTPLETLYVYVGGDGSIGGFNGGGSSQYGSAGGGASDVRTVAGDLTTRLLVAGGGGGGSGYVGQPPGGDAGNPNGQPSIGNCGGGGGTQSAGGASSCGPGNSGSLGQGGTVSTSWNGGAGGGGYYGGGTGGFSGGGGGGSDYVAAGPSLASYGLDATSTPSVAIQPVVAVATSPSSLTFPGTPKQSTSAPQTVTLTNDNAASVTVTGESLDYSNGQTGDDYFISSSTCGGIIAPGATCQLIVRFNPQATGPSNSGMFINTTDNPGTTRIAYVALSGTATALPIGTTGATGATGPAGAAGPTGATGATRPSGLPTKYRFGAVFSCHASAGRRHVVCTVYVPGAAGRRLTGRLIPVHDVGGGPSDARDARATGSTRGANGLQRITLRASSRLETGAYLLSLTYRHGRSSYTMRQRVHLR